MTVQADEQTSEPSTGHSIPLRRLATALVALEAVLAFLGALIVAVLAIPIHDHDGSNLAGLFSIAAIVLIVAVGIGFCARGVRAGRRWTRGPLVTWQLLQGGLGMSMLPEFPWVGALLAALAVAVTVLMLGRRVITVDANRF